MSNVAAPAARPVDRPLDRHRRTLPWTIGAVVVGTLVLTAASLIEFPMVPVPINMQTFAVTLIGARYGWRLGAVTVVAWLGEAAFGLPVLSGGAAGVHHFVGPTAGYLFAFPLAAALTGWLAERGWNGNSLGLAFAGMLMSNALCLVLGATWLGVMIGPGQAIVHGVTPFLLGAVLKSALGATLLTLLARGPRRAAE